MTAFKTILKSKDWINDGLVATPTCALCMSHLQVTSIEIYFNDFDFSVWRHHEFDNHCRLERISPSLSLQILPICLFHWL